mmetsp:Transcript_28080/g.53482  ORF Transcript_28080/g.53482 Transcript_28080/m.53482 type:complete len:202 (+) Transcript_28080:525-1130(+)
MSIRKSIANRISALHLLRYFVGRDGFLQSRLLGVAGVVKRAHQRLLGPVSQSQVLHVTSRHRRALRVLGNLRELQGYVPRLAGAVGGCLYGGQALGSGVVHHRCQPALLPPAPVSNLVAVRHYAPSFAAPSAQLPLVSRAVRPKEASVPFTEPVLPLSFVHRPILPVVHSEAVSLVLAPLAYVHLPRLGPHEPPQAVTLPH